MLEKDYEFSHRLKGYRCTVWCQCLLILWMQGKFLYKRCRYYLCRKWIKKKYTIMWIDTSYNTSGTNEQKNSLGYPVKSPGYAQHFIWATAKIAKPVNRDKNAKDTNIKSSNAIKLWRVVPMALIENSYLQQLEWSLYSPLSSVWNPPCGWQIEASSKPPNVTT